MPCTDLNTVKVKDFPVSNFFFKPFFGFNFERVGATVGSRVVAGPLAPGVRPRYEEVNMSDRGLPPILQELPGGTSDGGGGGGGGKGGAAATAGGGSDGGVGESVASAGAYHLLTLVSLISSCFNLFTTTEAITFIASSQAK
jgi:hypothetical protein